MEKLVYYVDHSVSIIHNKTTYGNVKEGSIYWSVSMCMLYTFCKSLHQTSKFNITFQRSTKKQKQNKTCLTTLYNWQNDCDNICTSTCYITDCLLSRCHGSYRQILQGGGRGGWGASLDDHKSGTMERLALRWKYRETGRYCSGCPQHF